MEDLNEYARKLLADGEWHDWNVVVTHLASRVQPGRAIRRAESQRRTASRNTYGSRDAVPPRSIARDVDEQIRIGARQIAKQVLNHRAFEIQPPGHVPPGERKSVRLRSGQ